MCYSITQDAQAFIFDQLEGQGRETKDVFSSAPSETGTSGYKRTGAALRWVFAGERLLVKSMSETPQKAPFRIKAHFDITAGDYGPIRFRTGTTMKDSREISPLCNKDLPPRAFAENLLAYLATEPLLKPEELELWPEEVLEKVCIEWWNNFRHGKLVSIDVCSLEDFQSEICKHHSMFSETANLAAVAMNDARRRFENTAFSMAKALASQRPFPISRETEMSELTKRMLDFRENALLSLAKRRTSFLAELFDIEALRERNRTLRLIGGGTQFSDVLSFKGSNSDPLGTKPWNLDKTLANFRALEQSDTVRFAKVLENINSISEKFLPSVSKVQAIAAQIDTSWIDRLKPDMSVASLIGLSSLTAAAKIVNPFDNSPVSAIRSALGDWRDVKMPWRMLSDSNLREQFYEDRGFDPGLVYLPEPAFSEALSNVGLVRHPTEEEEVRPIDEEGILVRRLTDVSGLILRFERKLRIYIDRVMNDKYGTNWEKARCHGNGEIYKGWLVKRDKDIASGVEPSRLIHYADFTEYAGLITKADNWNEVFEQVFQRKENIRESFFRLMPVRVCTMHARPITKTEQILANAEVTRILRAIGEFVEDDDLTIQ